MTYTLKQCSPLIVEKAGASSDVAPRITMGEQARVQARPAWPQNPWFHTKSKTGLISGPKN